MSIAVELEQLRDAIDATDRAPYFLTVGDDGRPHCVAVAWGLDGDETVAVDRQPDPRERPRPRLGEPVVGAA